MVETRAMRQRVDYISLLPDAILLHILSFLPMRDCIILSFVSKRWRNLWTQISSLTLNELETVRPLISKNKCPTCHTCPSPNSTSCRMHIIETARKKFADSVDRILLLHSGCTMNKFHLSINYESEAWQARKIDTWVKLAFKSDIKEIELSFYDHKLAEYLRRQGFQRRGTNQLQMYELSQQHVSPRVLKSLTLYCCKFKASGFKSFRLLQRLALHHVTLLDSSVTMFTSRCPILQDLHLEDCTISYDFMVSSEDLTIKCLYLDGCDSHDRLAIQIDISTPHLELLTVAHCFVTALSVRNATKPLNALIDITMFRMNEQDIDLAPFLAGIQSCRTLTLTSWTIQALRAEGRLIWQSQVLFPHLVRLSLVVCLGKHELPKIVYLLGRCKNLELLFIDVNKTLSPEELDTHAHNGGFDEDNFWLSQDWPYCCSQKNLKEVTVTGFTGAKHEINLLRFLLAKAEVLERMSISYTPSNSEQSMVVQDVIRELLSFDNASKKAQLWITSHPLQ